MLKSPQGGLRAYYDELAPEYDGNIEKGYAVPEWAERKLAPMRGRKVRLLDLACGSGWLLSLLQRMDISCEAIGVDFSPEMVRTAEAKRLYKRVLVGDLIEGIPDVGPRSFDLITILGALEFIPNASQLLIEVRESLAIGGGALLTFKANDEAASLVIKDIPDLGIKIHSYSRGHVLAIAGSAGLSVLSIEDGLAFVMPLTKKEIVYHFVHVRRDM